MPLARVQHTQGSGGAVWVARVNRAGAGRNAGLDMNTKPFAGGTEPRATSAEAGVLPSGGVGLPAETRIGHVHLTVSNLERALRFYRDALGFAVTQRMGDSAVFLSAGGYHHHIALNTWAGEGAAAPPPGRTGLYHLAILLPNRRELARAFRRLFDHGVSLEGAADHGVSEAIYLRDPDGHGVELYCDRDPAEWPRRGGVLRMTTEPLDLDNLLTELLKPTTNP